MAKRFEELQAALRSVGQEHVLKFFDVLTPDAQESLLAQLAGMNLDEIHRLIAEYVLQKPRLSLPERIDPPRWYPAAADASYGPQGPDYYRKIGEDLIRRGKVAVFCVAGGQGSRLGWEGPKGTFPAGSVTGKSLFQIFAEGIHSTQIRYGCAIPFYIMTSPLNHGDTVGFFSSREHFGLDPRNVAFFPQGVMPALDAATGRILLASKGEISMSPDGHGGSLKALSASGAIENMRSRGIEVISYIQVDNPHVRVVDPLFIGLHAAAPDSSGEMSSKMLPKTGPKEKLGNFCRVNGRTTVIEYSDLPDHLAHQRDEKGELLFKAGSIAIHCLGVDFVERLNRSKGLSDSTPTLRLPYHRADKKVPHVDLTTGNRVDPTEPNAVKLEMFVFDALPLCQSSIILETDRVEEFAPIKNAAGVDSVESSRQLQTERAARWLEQAGVQVPRRPDGSVDAVIEISPLTAVEARDLQGAALPARIESGTRIAL